MGMIILTALILTELAFMIWNIAEGDLHRKEKAVSAIAIFLIFVTLCLTGVIEWGFRYYILGFALALQSIIAVIRLIKQDKTEAFGRVIGKSVGKFVGKTILYTTVLMLAIICPQFTEPEPTGQYNVLEAKYTWTDENRTETFTDTGGKRKITVCVWYPENCSEKTPLIIFSHGAFGFSGSNYSTCTELASRGYTVAGIDHTYHALFTADTEGNVTIADMNFINTVMEHNATDNPEKEYTDNREWLDLRVKDIDFALNTIIGLSQSGDPIFVNTDTTKIGLFGHSLGGAAAAQTARNRSDISA
ncbi:MAG: acetylhydrolase, partial [Oscillospiraceae bacterium]|nr:acetylhydrolase [Oscillospiraceae bacterium]